MSSTEETVRLPAYRDLGSLLSRPPLFVGFDFDGALPDGPGHESLGRVLDTINICQFQTSNVSPMKIAKVAVAQVGSLEGCLSEIGIRQVSGPEVGIVQVTTHETSVVEVALAKIGGMQVGIRKIGQTKRAIARVDCAEI